MKKCCVCLSNLPEIEFGRNEKTLDGLQGMCKKCKLDYNRARTFKPDENPSQMKTCSSCHQQKPATLEFFSPQKNNHDGMCYACKECRSKQVSIWNGKHIETCSFCGKDRTVESRTPEGRPICGNCRRKLKAEVCSRCGKTRRVESRSPEGEPICDYCHKKSHLEICADCGRLEILNARLPEGGALCTSCQRSRSPHSMFRIYKQGANKRGHQFTLTLEEFTHLVTQPCCHYCNEPPELTNHLLGVDRLDNSQGYILGNVVPSCSICNLMKGKLGKEKFLLLVGKISRHHLV